MATKDLNERVAALEAKLGNSQPAPKTRSDRTSLAAEIDELERSLSAVYMDEELVEDFGTEDIVLEEEVGSSCPGMDDELMEDTVEVGMDPEFDESGDDVDIVEEPGMPYMEEEDEVEVFASKKQGSEAAPGIEDEITQDYLDEVEEEAHGTELTTGDSMLDVAPTKRSAAEYVARLEKASNRLDKVATYLERQGRIELAARIDKIADAIDARAKKATRRA